MLIKTDPIMPQADPITIDQVEALAQQELPDQVYDYYASGSDDQKALKSNRTDYDK